MNRPLHIVMTPVRNEAWVLPAFLKATSLWADYIIIADQMSSDGSRELYAQFPKVIVIDNTNPDFNEADRQAMLITKAREVAAGWDTLLWGLDADEVLPANWQETEDGKRIMNSKPGDVFWFKWAQLAPDKKHYGDSVFYPWLFHDDGKEPHSNYVRNMHSMRIPYPIEEKQMHYVNDFRVLHCGFLDQMRVAAKNRFYQFVDWELNHQSPIALARMYAAHVKRNQPKDYPYILKLESINFPFDLWMEIQLGATHTWFDDYIYERISQYSITQLRKLDIWDDELIRYYAISDSRRWIDKLIHFYLHNTQKYSHLFFIRAIDKVLKLVYK